MILKRYATALLSLAVLLVGAVQVALPAGITEVESWQLIALGAGAVVTFIVPLLDKTKWYAGALKVGAAVAASVASLIAPVIINGYVSPENWTVVLLGGLTALASAIGVSIRTDAEAVPAAGVVTYNYGDSGTEDEYDG